MAFSINKIYLVGNCAGDPELRYTPNGVATCNFNVATNRSFKDKDGNWSDAATFHRVVVWAKLAEFVSKQLKKGDPVVIEGRQENRSYQTDDNQTRYVSEVVADNVIPFARKPKAQAEPMSEAEKIFTQPPTAQPQGQAPTQQTTGDAPATKPEKKTGEQTELVNPDDIPF